MLDAMRLWRQLAAPSTVWPEEEARALSRELASFVRAECAPGDNVEAVRAALAAQLRSVLASASISFW